MFVIVARSVMDFETGTLKYPAKFSSGGHRRQVRRLPLVTQLVDAGDLGMDLDPIEILADLDPGFLPRSEGAWSAA